MEKLEIKLVNSVMAQDLRCKGWCHSKTGYIGIEEYSELPPSKYFE